MPDLASALSVSFSTRMKRSLGRCHPSTGRITLNAALRGAPAAHLEEVFCHEVAHVAAYRLFGPAAKPHGSEWRQLVASAGFEPRVRAAQPSTVRPPAQISSSVLPYEHRCPVCQGVRYARRPVDRWRCAECLEAGLGGELVITRHPPSKPPP